MNQDRVLRVIAAMEAAPDEQFDMRNIFTWRGRQTAGHGTLDPGQHTCGSAACVAGWTIWVAGPDLCEPGQLLPGPDATAAGRWLELSPRAYDDLFMPDGYYAGAEAGFTRLRAIAVLREMVDQHDAGSESPQPNWSWFLADGTPRLASRGRSL